MNQSPPPEPQDCTKCGKHHPRCKGHVESGPRKGEPCLRWPKKGIAVCPSHGGAAPQVKAAGVRRRAEEEAREIMATFGDEPTTTDPVEGLHLAICWARTHMDWLRRQVQRLYPDAVVFGDHKVTESDTKGLTLEQRAEVHAWVRLYNEERDRFVNYCAKAISAGLAEREVRLEEERGALIAEIIRAILADLELTPEQQSQALTVVPQHLRRATEPSMN